MIQVSSGTSQWHPEIPTKPALEHGRTETHVAVQGEVIVSRGPLMVFAQICDVSVGGARFAVPTEIMRPGHALTVQVRVGGRRLIGKNAAEVRWMASSGAGAWTVGVAFSQLAAQDLSALEALVAAKPT